MEICNAYSNLNNYYHFRTYLDACIAIIKQDSLQLYKKLNLKKKLILFQVKNNFIEHFKIKINQFKIGLKIKPIFLDYY